MSVRTKVSVPVRTLMLPRHTISPTPYFVRWTSRSCPYCAARSSPEVGAVAWSSRRGAGDIGKPDRVGRGADGLARGARTTTAPSASAVILPLQQRPGVVEPQDGAEPEPERSARRCPDRLDVNAGKGNPIVLPDADVPGGRDALRSLEVPLLQQIPGEETQHVEELAPVVEGETTVVVNEVDRRVDEALELVEVLSVVGVNE